MKAGFVYTVVTREEAINIYFSGNKEVYMADTADKTLHRIDDLSLDQLVEDLGDYCYFVKEEE